VVGFLRWATSFSSESTRFTKVFIIDCITSMISMSSSLSLASSYFLVYSTITIFLQRSGQW
jgi:hypothetical protein